MPCLFAFAAAFMPRVVLIIMWLFGTRINLVFSSFIWPLLGIIFVPYTTIMFVLVWSPATGVTGWDWVWVFLGLWLDLQKYATMAQNRRSVPGYPATAY